MSIRQFSCALCVLLAALPSSEAQATNRSWTTAASNNFGGSANWSGSSVPGVNDKATFSANGSYTVSFNSSGGLANPVLNQDLFVSAGNPTFTSSGTPYLYHLTGSAGTANITGGSLTLGSSGNPLNMTVDDDLVVRGGATLNVNVGSAVNTLDLLLGQNGSGTLNVSGASSLNVTGTSTQSVGLSSFSGLLNFQTSSTGSFAGPLEINNGNMTVQTDADVTAKNVSVGTSTGTGTLSINDTGSTLVQSGASTLTVGTTSTGTGAINIGTTSSGGSLTTGTGQLTINKKGTVTLGSASATGTLNANGDVLIDGGLLSLPNVGSTFALASGKTLTVQNGGQVTGYVSNNYAYTTSAGTVINVTGNGSSWALPVAISANSQMNIGSGASFSPLYLTVDGGILHVDGATLFGYPSVVKITVANGGQARFSFTGGTVEAPIVSIAGASSKLELVNLSTLTLSELAGEESRISPGGFVSVDGDIFAQLYNDSSFPVLSVDGGTLNAKSITTKGMPSSPADPTIFQFISGTVGITGPAGLTVGNEYWTGQHYSLAPNHTLNVTNTTTIPVNRSLTIDGGALNTGALAINGEFDFVRGTLGITGPAGMTIGAGGLLGSQLIVNNEQTINVTNVATVINGGQLILVGSHFSAGTLANSGEIVAVDSTFDGHIVNNNHLTVVGNVNFNGLVSGPGSVFGPGTAHFNGGFAPGASPADVSVEGNIALAESNTLFIEIGGATAGTQYDRLTVDGSATIDGALNIALLNGFTPTVGQQFTILTASSIVNNGFVLTGPAASSFSLIVGSTSVILQAIGLTGDYNNNGIVDAADYVLWRKSAGLTGPGLAADGNHNNQIDSGDYDVWRSHFGQTAGAGANSGFGTAVPEPNGLVTAFITIMVLISPVAQLRCRP